MGDQRDMPEWEHCAVNTMRLAVPGGHIYQYVGSDAPMLVFVPEAPSRCGHGYTGLCMYCFRDVLQGQYGR